MLAMKGIVNGSFVKSSGFLPGLFGPVSSLSDLVFYIIGNDFGIRLNTTKRQISLTKKRGQE
jgi:hypothetical protein